MAPNSWLWGWIPGENASAPRPQPSAHPLRAVAGRARRHLSGLSKIQSIRGQTGRQHSPTMHQYWRLARWPLSCRSARMDHSELRVRIRLLMASGELPPGPPLGDKILPGQVARLTRIVIGRATQGSCLICDEPGANVSYTYADRKVIRLHSACDAVWQQGAM